MFEITDDPRGFKRLTIAGQIDEDQMRSGLEAFLAALPQTGRADFLYTITDFEFPALQAIAVEFGYLPRLFAAVTKIGKVAVVADADWLRKAAELEGMVLPGMDIKSFRPDELDDAETWLTGELGDHMPM
jgi:hypothetical protein